MAKQVEADGKFWPALVLSRVSELWFPSESGSPNKLIDGLLRAILEGRQEQGALTRELTPARPSEFTWALYTAVARKWTIDLKRSGALHIAGRGAVNFFLHAAHPSGSCEDSFV